MARLSETVKNFLGFNTLAEDYDNYEETESSSSGLYEENESVKNDSRFAAEETSSANESKSRISNFLYEESPVKKSTGRTSAAAVNKQETMGRMLGMNASDNALSVVLSRPSEYKDCTAICSKLRERTTVVINFEHLKSKEDKKRILDFIYGCCYAIDGNAQRISEHVYIVAPYNVDIYDDAGEAEESVNDNSIFF